MGDRDEHKEPTHHAIAGWREATIRSEKENRLKGALARLLDAALKLLVRESMFRSVGGGGCAGSVASGGRGEPWHVEGEVDGHVGAR